MRIDTHLQPSIEPTASWLLTLASTSFEGCSGFPACSAILLPKCVSADATNASCSIPAPEITNPDEVVKRFLNACSLSALWPAHGSGRFSVKSVSRYKWAPCRGEIELFVSCASRSFDARQRQRRDKQVRPIDLAGAYQTSWLRHLPVNIFGPSQQSSRHMQPSVDRAKERDGERWWVVGVVCQHRDEQQLLQSL